MSQTRSQTEMPLSYKARRRWSLVILVIGLPAYIVVAVTVIGLIDRPSTLVELLIYGVLGIAWAFPLRFVFRGIGKPDPDSAEPGSSHPPDAGNGTGTGEP